MKGKAIARHGFYDVDQKRDDEPSMALADRIYLSIGGVGRQHVGLGGRIGILVGLFNRPPIVEISALRQP
jgi:hypothetical protein